MSLDWLVRFFERLNTFRTVIVVLALALAVNGFLLYQRTETATVPVPPAALADTAVETTIPPRESEETAAEAFETPGPDASVSPEESAPESPAASITPVSGGPDLEGLGEAIRGCAGDRGECVRGFVAEVEPGARYLGGRVDLNAGGPGQNEEVLYFEGPTLGACESAKQEHQANDELRYTVIVVGAGSFERGSECIPAS